MMNSSMPPLPLSEIRRLRKPVKNANREHQIRLGLFDRLAVWATRRIGTAGFFLIIVIWSGAWLGWNSFAPLELRFDPFPAFVIWLLISDTIQLLSIPLILAGQSLESRHSELRAELDYDLNRRAEREIEAILMHLEYQNELLQTLLKSQPSSRKKH